MIMADRAWTQTELGRELGRDQTWVSRAIAGHRDLRTREASAFLAKVGWELRIAPKSDREATEDDPVKRREFVAGTAGLASVMFVRTPQTTQFHDPKYVDLLTQRVIRSHNETGGDSLSRAVLHHARQIQSAASSGGHELLTASSEFMRAGSYVLHQAGRFDAGIALANSALLYASKTEHQDQKGLAHLALSFICGFPRNDDLPGKPTGDIGRSIMYAQRGLKVPGITDETRAYLNVFLARGLANVPGHERQTRMAVDRALNIESIPSISRADIIGTAGEALRDARADREASKMLDDAVHLSGSISPFLQAAYLGDQVLIALEARDLAMTAHLMDALSYAIPLTDSTRIDEQVRLILRMSKPWASVPEIRDARERLRISRIAKGDPK